MAIVKSPRWHQALRNVTISTMTGQETTPLRKLIRKMPGEDRHELYYKLMNPIAHGHQVIYCTSPRLPSWSLPTEVAEEVFNRCTTTNETKDGQIRPDSKEYQVIFNYEFLEDFRDPTSRTALLQRAFTTYVYTYNVASSFLRQLVLVQKKLKG